MSTALVFFAFLLLGVPVAFVLLAAAVWFAVDLGNLRILLAFPSNFFAGMENFDLLAIPLFILLGEVMRVGGLTKKLFALGRRMAGRLPRKLAFVVLGSNMFLAAILGSANAQVAVMTPAVIPEMEEAGYRKSFAAVLTAGAALLGPIIPPSMVFIIYAVVAEVSINSMFLAGILPGLLLAGFIAVIILLSDAFVSGRAEVALPPAGRAEVLPILAAAIVPAIIIWSILGGVATPTESAAVAVMVALIVVRLFFDPIRLHELTGILVRAASNTATVLVLIAAVKVFGFVLSYYRVPGAVSALLMNLSASPTTFLLLVVLLVLILGAFMDGLAAIIVLVPILLPVATGTFGISPVVFGVVFCITAVLGVITPPVGTALFIASAISGVGIATLSLRILPFVGAGLAVVLLVIAFPWLATALL